MEDRKWPGEAGLAGRGWGWPGKAGNCRTRTMRGESYDLFPNGLYAKDLIHSTIFYKQIFTKNSNNINQTIQQNFGKVTL